MKKIPEIPNDKVVLLNISRCYNANDKEEAIYRRPNVYEMTRKYWKIDKNRASLADFICGVANGIIVSVYENASWKYVDYRGTMRCEFEADEVNNSYLLGLNVANYVRCQNPISYINF